MEQNKKFSMHTQAKETTEKALAYLCAQAYNKSDELNHLGETVIQNAKMELYIAELEGVPFDDMSSTAQKLALNPNLTIQNHFVGKIDYIDNDGKTPLLDTTKGGTEIFVVDINQKATEQPASQPDEETEPVIESAPFEDDGTETPFEDESTGGDTGVIEEINPVRTPVVKSFDKYKLAYTGAVAQKIYKATVLKPARELVKALIDEETHSALNRLVNFARAEATCEITPAHEEQKQIFEHYSTIVAIYDAVIKGTELEDLNVTDISQAVSKVAELDSLAYTIVSNAEEFREDNAEILNSKNLTAGTVKQYYTALGKQNSTEAQKTTGQAVIKDELSADVASIMAR